MKRLLILICIFSLLSVPVCFAAEGESTYYLDDTDLAMTGSWSRSFLDADCYNGTSAVGSSGASFTFKFLGSGFTLYGLTYTNSSSFYVYVDGDLQGKYTSGTSINYVTGKQLFSVENLDLTEHTITVVSTGEYVVNPDTGRDTSGRLYVDYITYQSPVIERSESDFYSVLFILIVVLLFLKLIYDVWRDWRLSL